MPGTKIYIPDHFKRTWKRFLELTKRDRQSASELIRIWVEGYVHRHDPGNPQRSLNHYIEGSEEWQKADSEEQLKVFIMAAADGDGWLDYSYIVENLVHMLNPKHRARRAEELARELSGRGVKIVY